MFTFVFVNSSNRVIKTIDPDDNFIVFVDRLIMHIFRKITLSICFSWVIR